MTLSSSVGWPLIGPSCERQALAVDLGAEDERQQQQADPGRGPRVLVAAQPAVGSDDDREDRDRRDRQQQPAELDRRQPERPAEDVWVDRAPAAAAPSAAAPIPPSMPDRRQQDLVGPPPGQDLGDVRHQQRPEVDREEAGSAKA